ncbi:MAG TPA: class I SAM-dependent methyltransferase [Pyrinomonadaceae bacterium]|jgi:SAM-dependent methyltransferase
MATTHSPPSLFNSYRHFEEFTEGREYVRNHFGKLAGLNVLDAGCGSASWLFDLTDCHVTGIDVSAKQLARNHLLRDGVCADLQTYENEAWLGHFDLILCLDVLEHLKSPAPVIEKFISWMKPDAALVLAYPNPQSLKGRVTKYSPHILHRLFYRISIGTPLSDEGDEKGPFNTFLSPDIELLKLASLLEAHSLKVDLLVSIESFQNKLIKRYLSTPLVDQLNKIFLRELRTRVNTSATDFILVASRANKEDV